MSKHFGMTWRISRQNGRKRIVKHEENRREISYSLEEARLMLTLIQLQQISSHLWYSVQDPLLR